MERISYNYKTNRPYFKAWAKQLEGQGLGVQKIAEVMGVSRETARHLLDEDGYQKKLERNRLYEREKRVRMKEQSLLIPKVNSRVPSETIEARLAEIPDDTRSKTARVFGDPLPGRSALDMRRAA